ncbi:hypothetical protein F4810DRAFT_716558 [Camillea tinctor]|nr:hypothetical protein F4810DRAFT_716558 [Camillea tinctor]
MCRRVITHHMHHDVRQPMIIDACAPNDPPVFVNPLNTPSHTCEIAWPQAQWLLNKPRSCSYHTCCLPQVDIEFCADAKGAFIEDQDCGSELDGYSDYLKEEIAVELEPEECPAFSLVHRYEQLSYFGIPEAFNPSSDIFFSPNGYGSPVGTWRGDLLEITYGDDDWCPWFEHDAMYRPQWESVFFKECEKLYQAEVDARIQDAVMTDLTDAANDAYDRGVPFCSQYNYYENSTTAFHNLLRADQVLADQKKLVIELAKWALDECGGCEGYSEIQPIDAQGTTELPM